MAKRFSFRDLPIGRKLLAVGAAVTGVMLLGLSAFMMVRAVTDWRSQTVHELTSNAKIIAANAAPALLFNDRAAAAETLSALSEAPDIVYAAVYDIHGVRFAVHGVEKAGPGRLAPDFATTGHSFSRNAVTVSEPIVFKGERLGSIYLKADLRELIAALVRDGAISLAALAIAFGLSIVLFYRLQRGIVRPITQLSGMMSKVSEGGSYSTRAPDFGRDEVGVLARTFNDMLGVIEDRDTRLAQHQAQLEDTVRQRTGELNQANARLQEELAQRAAAQEALRAHDAMLKAVAHGAGELLGTLNLDEAITAVLELIGQTLAVSRVQLGPISSDREGHLRSSVSYEWCAPGLRPMLDDPMFRSLDITTAIPALATASLLGERTVLRIDEVPASFREPFERAGMTSMLFTPVMTEDKLWGGLWFMDSAAPPRAWNWAETDTLTTLAGLIGVSTTRSRYVKELADANTIVQNSPTVLYRLKGEPLLPVTYVSHNITKFGYDPKKLVADEATFQTMVQMLIHPDDQAKLFDAISEVVSKNAGGGTIEARLTAPGGAIRWIENRYTPVRDEIGRLVEIEGIITDVTERKLAEEKIAALARTDALTGLANRATFVERLHQAFASSRRGAPAFAVLYLDLDHFKDVNDTRGHPTGDLLLREAGERLKARARESDIVARLGGDEFAILQMDIAGPADAGALASDIVAALAVPYLIEDNKLRVTASVGISPFTPDLADPDAMLAQADLALYRAKEEGRDQFRFHTAELDRDVNERVTIAEDLRSALERDELFLQYQPQVELMSGRIVGMEALVRWRHPVRGTLRPAAFIPIAESTGVIHALGHWVLENACRQMRTWKDQGVAPPTIAINISMLQLKNGADLVHDIANTLAETGLDAGELELDVTESMLARVNFAQNDVIDQLKALGVKIALDDFGADYSSFDYLRAYRVNHLKVARQFIENATRDASLAATVRAILGAAHELGIQVIAEGVETSDQRALLLSIGANTRGQGFYFSEPVDVGNATELLTLGSIDRRDKPAAGA